MMAHPYAHLLWIVPLALLAVYVGSPRHLGTRARTRVARMLRSGLDRSRYTVLENLTLPAGGGAFHVDVVVVSRHGVVVIRTLTAKGRLSGTRVQPLWLERRWGRVRRFDNPLHANDLDIQRLERLLGLRPSRFLGLVAISGRDRLEAGLPERVIAANRVLQRIRSEARPLLEPEEADRVVATLRREAVPPTWRESGRQWKALRLALFGVVLAGTYAVYRPFIHEVVQSVQSEAEQRMAPEEFHPDGRPRTEYERWEDSLICSWSVDTGRCSCYEPDGTRAELEVSRCRALAERGSVLDR